MDSFTELDRDLKQTDIDFCDLYFKAIKKLLDIDDPKNTNGFWRYLKLLRTVANANCEFFENPNDQDYALTTLFKENFYYRIAYIYRNSTLYSSAVAFHFQNVLESNPAILEQLLQKRKIRICSLGCGPASDVVAVVKILQSAAEQRHVDLDIKVTVVDADLSWKNTCLGVLRCIPMFARTISKIKFIQADLSQFFTLETVNAIQNADVVTIVKFSSEFVGGYLSCRDTITEITQIMNPESLLFFLDRPNIAVVRSCGGISGEIQNFELVYEEIYDFFNLHPAVIEKNYHLYEGHFGANVCNTCLKVFCRAWIKIERESNFVESPICFKEDNSEISSTECGKRLEDSLILSQGGDNLTSSVPKSKVGKILASPPPSFDCGRSLEASSITNKGGHILESVTVLNISEPESSSKISPRNRFSNKREKFDLLEFFRQRAYETWHHSFFLKMVGMGWNERRIQECNQSYQEMWDCLHTSLQDKIKIVEDVQEQLIMDMQRRLGVICEPIWKQFMISKRELAFVKRTIYCELIIILRGHLKSISRQQN